MADAPAAELETNPLLTVSQSLGAQSMFQKSYGSGVPSQCPPTMIQLSDLRVCCCQDSPFPNFNAVAAEHVVPGIRGLLTECGKDIDSLEGSVTPAWEGLAEPLERIVDRLSRAWGTVSHLKAVKDSEGLRKAYEEVKPAAKASKETQVLYFGLPLTGSDEHLQVQPERVKLLQRLSQSRALYEAFKQIREGPSWESLSEAQKRIVESELRDFVLGGVALEVRHHCADCPLYPWATPDTACLES